MLPMAMARGQVLQLQTSPRCGPSGHNSNTLKLQPQSALQIKLPLLFVQVTVVHYLHKTNRLMQIIDINAGVKKSTIRMNRVNSSSNMSISLVALCKLGLLSGQS